jgi:hypothetical protein
MNENFCQKRNVQGHGGNPPNNAKSLSIHSIEKLLLRIPLRIAQLTFSNADDLQE